MARLVKAQQTYAQIPYLKYGLSQVLLLGNGGTPVAEATTTLSCSAVLIQPTVNVLFSVNLDAVTPENDPIAWAGQNTRIGVILGQKISFIKMTGEPDGLVIVTPLEEE